MIDWFMNHGLSGEEVLSWMSIWSEGRKRYQYSATKEKIRTGR
jgi:hypothetical protein